MAYEDDHFIDTTKMVWNYSLFTQEEVHLFGQGKLFYAHEKFGSHHKYLLETDGYYFAVWAPNATEVCVVGEFNGWKRGLHPLFVRQDSSGIWEGFIPRMPQGTVYKYFIKGFEGKEIYKADPFANFAELRPGTCSLTWNMYHEWNDTEWMKKRSYNNSLEAPWSVYEVHLASWMRPDKNNHEAFNTYRKTAALLVPYVKRMGFTHVEFMPVMEHPYDGSWGYQDTGYFAATSRFGNPQDLMFLIEELHKNDIGVIMDWVPSHFPNDDHGLYMFDGAHTYEYADMRKGFHKDWNSYIFNYKRGEVRSFLISSAHFWFKHFHIDGIRVDAVNSIIRLDFSRAQGEWEPNENGGNDNIEAISFLKDMNDVIYTEFPDVQTIAEEASDWAGITNPTSKGGFGFGMKWMMGWMHDSFNYFKKDWRQRKKHQNDFSFSMMYFYDEKFMLPISHDEVVHGKSPMLYKMPGDEFRKFANLRLLYTYMYTHPGAKLLFMGNEFGQTNEWDYNSELQWELLQHNAHHNLQTCVQSLNYLYKNEPSLHEWQFDKKGFQWESLQNEKDGIIIYRRMGKDKSKDVVIILNVSEKAKSNWEIILNGKTNWKELLNTNDIKFWGSGNHLNHSIECEVVDKRKKIYKIKVNVAALSALVIQ